MILSVTGYTAYEITRKHPCESWTNAKTQTVHLQRGHENRARVAAEVEAVPRVPKRLADEVAEEAGEADREVLGPPFMSWLLKKNLSTRDLGVYLSTSKWTRH